MLLDTLWFDLKRLIKGDIPSHLSKRDELIIYSINLFAVFMVTTSFIYAIIFRNFNEPILVYTSVILGIICLVPLILNTFRLFELCKIIYTIQAPALILIFGFIFGRDFGIGYFFIVAFAFPFIFFDSRRQWVVTVYFIYNSACLLYYDLGNPDVLPILEFTSTVQAIMASSVYVILFFLCYLLFVNLQQVVSGQKAGHENQHLAKIDPLQKINKEIHSPMVGLATVAKMLEDNPTPKDRQVLLQLLQTNLRRLNETLSINISLPQSHTPNFQLNSQKNKLSGIVESVIETYKRPAIEKGIILNLEYDPNLELIYVFDEVKLAQILGHLLSNAVKFTNSGHIQLIVSQCQTLNKHDKVLFEVKDTGIGIPGKQVEQIFEQYTQVKSSTHRQVEGLGNGLAKVKSLLKMLGTSMGVESEPGKGSKFYFYLNMERSPTSKENS